MASEKNKVARVGSDSLAQRESEKIALALVVQTLELQNVELQRRFQMGVAFAVVDAFSETQDEVVLLEVNARVGTAMKTATKNKVLKDTSKMLLIKRANAEAWRDKRVRKVLVFLDPISRASFGPKAWANQAWATFEIETHICEIPLVHREALIKAQAAQDLRSDAS